MGERMVAEKKIEEFVSRLRQAASSNLLSIVLYGSTVSGEFHPEFSDINLLCLFGDLSFSVLERLAPAVSWWLRQKQPTPLLMTREELEHATDVFVIELMDIQAHHRILFGEDIVARLTVATQLHRAQVEYELREKLILLRRGVLLAADNKAQLWELMVRSLSAFITLIRHGLMLAGERPPETKREIIRLGALRFNFESSPFEEILNLREGKTDTRKLNAKDVAARYLRALEQVTAAVDRMVDAPGQRSS
jgi:predicted nucleotidyltransferase